jgi:hypothetical protein
VKPPRVLTWHVHGSYLRSLAHARAEFVLPMRPDRGDGYAGCAGPAWPANVREVAAADVRHLDLDVVLFQTRKNYLVDQFDILSPEQQRLPRIHLEHDPPREHPTDTCHPVDDPEVLVVHVTHFNRLMWNCGRSATRVIEHGVPDRPDVSYSGELERGIVVINNLRSRGRRLGIDVFERVRERVPLDLVGMQSEELGGLGEIPHAELARFTARYRFLFNPIRYTSLGLAVCEAMMVGLPIVGLATTEMATAVENDVTGYVDTNVDMLVERMLELCDDRGRARKLGLAARRYARRRFGIGRFARDWENTFAQVTGIGGEEAAA